jgi:acetoin utilization deacetylase AcuC-like enzyme
MRLHACDSFPVPLPEGHRFPMDKYAAVRASLLERGIYAPEQIVAALPAPDEALLRAHTLAWVRASARGDVEAASWRRVGFPWSEALVQRSRASVGGTLAATGDAIQHGAGGVLAGGTHHAGPDSGEGYCVYNDLAVAALDALARGVAQRVAIVDLDVHQGNGTAAILGGREDCFLLSVHGARNYPFHKVPGTLDLGLPDGTDDAGFLDAVRQGLHAVFAWRPDLVLYQAGVDPLEGDRLGRLRVSMEGLRAREELVIGGCARAGIPMVVTMGGGYAVPVSRTVEAHAQTFEVLRGWFD